MGSFEAIFTILEEKCVIKEKWIEFLNMMEVSRFTKF